MDFTVTQWGGTTEQLLAYLDRESAAPQSKERTCFQDWGHWRNLISYSLDVKKRNYEIPPKIFLAHRNGFGGLLILTKYQQTPAGEFYISFVCSTIAGGGDALISHVKSMLEVNVLKLSAVMGTQKFYVNQGFRFQTHLDDPVFRRGEAQDMEMIWKKDEGYMADTEGGRRKRRKTRRSKKRVPLTKGRR